MTVQLSLPDSGRKFEVSFVVATPEGMRAKLNESRWSSMFLPELIVVDRYDLNEIRQAAVDRVVGDDPDAVPQPDATPTIVQQIKHQ